MWVKLLVWGLEEVLIINWDRKHCKWMSHYDFDVLPAKWVLWYLGTELGCIFWFLVICYPQVVIKAKGANRMKRNQKQPRKSHIQRHLRDRAQWRWRRNSQDRRENQGILMMGTQMRTKAPLSGSRMWQCLWGPRTVLISLCPLEHVVCASTVSPLELMVELVHAGCFVSVLVC